MTIALLDDGLFQINDGLKKYCIVAYDYDTQYYIETLGKYSTSFEYLVNDLKNLTTGNFHAWEKRRFYRRKR